MKLTKPVLVGACIIIAAAIFAVTITNLVVNHTNPITGKAISSAGIEMSNFHCANDYVINYMGDTYFDCYHFGLEHYNKVYLCYERMDLVSMGLPTAENYSVVGCADPEDIENTFFPDAPLYNYYTHEYDDWLIWEGLKVANSSARPQCLIRPDGSEWACCPKDIPVFNIGNQIILTPRIIEYNGYLCISDEGEIYHEVLVKEGDNTDEPPRHAEEPEESKGDSFVLALKRLFTKKTATVTDDSTLKKESGLAKPK